MNIEDYSFSKNDGTERKLSDIIQERVDVVRDSYFSGLTPVNDVSVGSMNYSLIVNQSICQYDLEFLIEMTNRNNLIQYSQGDALDDIGAKKGIYRHDAEFSTGFVSFELANPLSSPLTIYDGFELSTDDSVIFLTKQVVQLNSGEKKIDCEVVCEESGTIGNIKRGSLNIMISELPYDITVTNGSDFTNGVDEESDEDFKERILDSILNYPVGTSKWYENVAKTLVKDALYHKISSTSGRISYKPTEGVSETQLKSLFDKKENQVVNIELEFQKATSRDVIDETKSITVIIDSQYSFESVKNRIILNITNYVDKLGLGEDFKINCIKFCCESVEGVKMVILDGYNDINDITNDQYAHISNDIIINQG